MKFDYAVIGSGPSVYHFLLGMKDSGKKIAVIEKKRFGGICPNEGCEPKIFLEGAVRAVLTSKRLQGKGINSPAKLDWRELIQHKKTVFAPFPESTRMMYENLSATTLQGEASFIDAHTIKVGDEVTTADRIVIATGRKPRQLPFPGQEYMLTSTDVFDLEQVPTKAAIIGSGYVGMEIATLLAAAGVKVTMIQRSARPLRSFNRQHVEQLVAEMKNTLSVKFSFNTSVKAINKLPAGYEVETNDGQVDTYDEVINASGRVPNIASLNLVKAGVQFNERGIEVDGFLKTSADNIFAMGDVLDKEVPGLTPTAQFEADYLSAALTGKEDGLIKYPVIGTVAFTFPQLAQAGVKVDQARLTLIFDRRDNRLVGAAEISQTAVDDINALIPVMSLDVDPTAWKTKMLMAFPGLAYKIRTLI